MTHTRYQRHNAAYWENILAEFHQSNQSAPKFCEGRGIAYASFCKWRQQSAAKDKTAVKNPSAFIDLQSLATTADPSWHIVLKLGNGVEVVLSQAASC